MERFTVYLFLLFMLGAPAGCATQKESHTARTGVEQLLISSAVDRSLDHFDYSPLANKQVYVENKYLDCVDKNYILLALRSRILKHHGRLVEKADSADVIFEVSSGGVGTDGQELFVGIPEIPLPPPSPIAIPRLAFVTRTKLNGTAKLLVVAYDAKTKAPILPSGASLARSDHQNWNVLGMGPVQTGSVTREVAAASSQETDLSVAGAFRYAANVAPPLPRPLYRAEAAANELPVLPVATPRTEPVRNVGPLLPSMPPRLEQAVSEPPSLPSFPPMVTRADNSVVPADFRPLRETSRHGQ